MQEFYQVKNMIYDEIDQISHKGQLNKDAICVLGDLVDILKDIGTIEMFEENIYVEDNGAYHTFDENKGYSTRMPRMRYYEGDGYQMGNSYRYGSYPMRDRYSRRGGYSREDGKEHMIQKLEHLMNEATDEQDRQSIQRLIDQMHNN